MNSCVGKGMSCRKVDKDDADNIAMLEKYQGSRPQRKTKIELPKGRMPIENVMSVDTNHGPKGHSVKNEDDFTVVDLEDAFEDLGQVDSAKTPKNKIIGRILPLNVPNHENVLSFGQKFDENIDADKKQKFREVDVSDQSKTEKSQILLMEKHRKITFNPNQNKNKNDVKAAEQTDLEKKPLDMEQSQSNTIGSTVHPKQGDNRGSYNSANINMFDVNASHYNEEEEIENMPKSKFFDLAHFGPKKKRSSTDPGKYHQQQMQVQDQDQDVSDNSRNPFSDNKTQTISQRDDISQHQSILLDPNEAYNQPKLTSQEIPEFNNDLTIKSTQNALHAHDKLGYSSNSMVQPQRKTVSKKPKWGFLSFLSGSATIKDDDKVMNALQQKKDKKKHGNNFKSSADLQSKNNEEPVVEDIPDELFVSKMEDPVDSDNYQSITKTLKDVDDNYIGYVDKSADKFVYELPDGGSFLSDNSFAPLDQKKLHMKTINTPDSNTQFNQKMDLDQSGNPYAHLLQKANNTISGAQFAEQLQSNYTDMTDDQFAFAKNIDSDVSGDAADGDHFGYDEDDNKFNFSKHNPDKDKTFPTAKDRSDKSGRKNLKNGQTYQQDAFEQFEDLLDGHQNIKSDPKSHYNKSPQLGRRNLVEQQIKEEQDNTRHTMNPVGAGQQGAADLSISFRDQSRNKLITMHHNNKKNVFKKLWHKAPVLNINTYKIQFSMQGEKVSFDHNDSYPICLLGVKFKPEKKPMAGQNYSKDIKKRYKTMIKTKFFESIIWCSYRNKLENDILSDASSQRYLAQVLPNELNQFVSYNSDMNWGCTVRVGQMLICNTLMRHLLIDSDFRYTKAEVFDKFGLQNRFSISYLLEHPSKWQIYQNVLAQVIDNMLPEDQINGKQIQPLQAFQIQNVSKMAVATQSTMPGTWFGVQAVSHLYCKLNRLFRPMCDDFQICVLGNGFVHFNRIISKMRKVITLAYTTKNYDHLDDEDDQVRKQLEKEGIESIFHNEIQVQRQWKEHFRIIKYPGIQLRHDQGEPIEQAPRVQPGNLVGGYRNGCLVIINCMLGVYKIEKEYFDAIRYIFHEPNIMMGAMGGRPGQALYFVGLQNYELIFLDPHLVQEAPSYGEDEWIDCNFNNDEFKDFKNQMNQMNSSASISIKKKLKKTIPLKIPRKFSTKPISDSNQGPQYPKIRLKESDRQTYHCGQMRKIHISKCDPTMAFAFYLRNEGDLRQFYWLMKRGKERFGANWPFSLMDMQLMDEYFKEYKDYQDNSLSKQWMPGAFSKNAKAAISNHTTKIASQNLQSSGNHKLSLARQQNRIQELSNNFIPKTKKAEPKDM